MLWLLHGNLGSKADWYEIAAMLEQAGIATRCVDLWELLCCDVCSLQQAAARLNAVVAAQSSEPAVLAGYSLGGRVALHMLLDRPELYRSGVLLGAHCGLSLPQQRKQRLDSDLAWASLLMQGSWSEFLLRWDAQAVFEGGDALDAVRLGEWQKRRAALYKRRLPIARAFVHWSLGRQQDLRPALRKLEMPLGWVCGALDAKFAAIAREMCATQANFYWHEMAGAGHRLLLQKPRELAEYLLRFYRGEIGGVGAAGC